MCVVSGALLFYESLTSGCSSNCSARRSVYGRILRLIRALPRGSLGPSLSASLTSVLLPQTDSN